MVFPCQLGVVKEAETITDFQDGDIIITEHFALKVAKTGRGWFAEVSDSQHPCNGAYVFGDKCSSSRHSSRETAAVSNQ